MPVGRVQQAILLAFARAPVAWLCVADIVRALPGFNAGSVRRAVKALIKRGELADWGTPRLAWYPRVEGVMPVESAARCVQLHLVETGPGEVPRWSDTPQRVSYIPTCGPRGEVPRWLERLTPKPPKEAPKEPQLPPPEPPPVGLIDLALQLGASTFIWKGRSVALPHHRIAKHPPATGLKRVPLISAERRGELLQPRRPRSGRAARLGRKRRPAKP